MNGEVCEWKGRRAIDVGPTLPVRAWWNQKNPPSALSRVTPDLNRGTPETRGSFALCVLLSKLKCNLAVFYSVGQQPNSVLGRLSVEVSDHTHNWSPAPARLL